MDIAFLIDGSGSIEKSDFSQMKAFVKALMGQFASTNSLVSTGHGGLWKGDTDVGRSSHTAGGGGGPVEELMAGPGDKGKVLVQGSCKPQPKRFSYGV